MTKVLEESIRGLESALHRNIRRFMNMPRWQVTMRIRGYHYSRLLANAGPRLRVSKGAVIARPQNISVGADVYLGDNIMLFAWDETISIGNNVLVAAGVKMITRTHRFQDRSASISSQGYKNQPIVIEDDVWIGFNAVILSGVTVGRGGVVGAGAVVTRDVEPYHIVGGVPARDIGTRSPRDKDDQSLHSF